MSFRSLYHQGFARVAACTLRAHVADPAANSEAILALARTAHEQGAALAIFPEQRFQSVAESFAALESILAVRPTSPY